jgi:plasmid segregation protein ParM
VEEAFGKDDMEFEIDGRRGYAGSIAQHEDEYGVGSMYGDSKAHQDTKIRVLLAIHRYLNRYCPDIETLSIVTGQPIKRHKDAEKNAICDMLEGPHTFTVNGQMRSITIDKVGVAPEGSAAFWSNPSIGMGKIRIIDCGSGTINGATIIDKRHVNNASNTFNFGMETVKNKKDLAGVARGIIRSTTQLKWDRDDTVLICGGIAEGIAPYIAEHYTNTEILIPGLKGGGGLIGLHPVYANAAGFFVLAKGAFG